MAFFNIRQWLDRISEHPNRRTLTNVNDPTDVQTYDLSRAEGTVSVQGTAITAANLNDLEGRIASAFTAVDNAMPEANPAETATASLTKLKVDGTVYDIEGGGGGTTIEKITKAEWDAMTAEEREAFIGVVEDTNADYVPLTAENIPFDSNDSIAVKITSIEEDISDAQDDISANTQAIEDIQTAVIGTPDNGAITAGTDCTVRAANIIKINHIVVFTAYINFTTPITSRKTIATISSQFRPSGQNVTFITGGSNAINSLQNRMTNGIITATGDVIVGDIIVPSSESIKEVMITTTYYTAN